jgi:uncharacterized protein YkwD
MRQLKALFGFSLILYALYGIRTVAVPVAQTCCPPPAKKVVRPVGNKQEMEVIALVNKERTRRGMKPLAPSPKLMAVSEQWSQNQASRRRMYHSRNGYGENVAYGQPNSYAVMTDWMNSRGHRNNILSQRYDSIGVGYVTASNGTPYWTQSFQ